MFDRHEHLLRQEWRKHVPMVLSWRDRPEKAGSVIEGSGQKDEEAGADLANTGA